MKEKYPRRRMPKEMLLGWKNVGQSFESLSFSWTFDVFRRNKIKVAVE